MHENNLPGGNVDSEPIEVDINDIQVCLWVRNVGGVEKAVEPFAVHKFRDRRLSSFLVPHAALWILHSCVLRQQF